MKQESPMTAIEKARSILSEYKGAPIRIMEVCGTHTHEIFRQGIRNLLPENVVLISGPGCPVCVTPVSFIDEAVMLALEKDCSTGIFFEPPAGTGKRSQDPGRLFSARRGSIRQGTSGRTGGIPVRRI